MAQAKKIRVGFVFLQRKIKSDEQRVRKDNAEMFSELWWQGRQYRRRWVV